MAAPAKEGSERNVHDSLPEAKAPAALLPQQANASAAG
jgi:hypothetical protein